MQNQMGSKGTGGTLTAIAISNPQKQDIIQEYSTLGNNSKHLQSLSPPIEFPLQLAINANKGSSLVTAGLR
jgi:hypothetical protein